MRIQTWSFNHSCLVDILAFSLELQYHEYLLSYATCAALISGLFLEAYGKTSSGSSEQIEESKKVEIGSQNNIDEYKENISSDEKRPSRVLGVVNIGWAVVDLLVIIIGFIGFLGFIPCIIKQRHKLGQIYNLTKRPNKNIGTTRSPDPSGLYTKNYGEKSATLSPKSSNFQYSTGDECTCVRMQLCAICSHGICTRSSNTQLPSITKRNDCNASWNNFWVELENRSSRKDVYLLQMPLVDYNSTTYRGTLHTENSRGSAGESGNGIPENNISNPGSFDPHEFGTDTWSGTMSNGLETDSDVYSSTNSFHSVDNIA